MKKLSFIPILVLAAFISSCSHYSVTKRRYNKGYYVQHHSTKKHADKHPAQHAQSQATAYTPLEAVKAAKETQQAAERHATPVSAPALASNHLKPNRPSAKPSLTRTEKRDLVYAAIKNPVKTVRALPKHLPTAATGDDALSLLWVVIVVLLILYLLSFLFDGFGLGGIIHVLAVIIAVLLILWLLKIL